MPVSCRIDQADGVVVLTSDQDTTFDEWAGALNDAREPEWRPRLRVLHDGRQVTRIPPLAEAQSRGPFVARRANVLGIERWAVVVPEDAFKRDAYWLAAVLADREGAGCRMFTDLAAARAWPRAPSNGSRLAFHHEA